MMSLLDQRLNMMRIKICLWCPFQYRRRKVKLQFMQKTLKMLIKEHFQFN